MRLFVAIALPESLKEQLRELLTELRRCRADVRWVNPASMHLTLKFLGEVGADELGPIDEALRQVAGAASPTHGQVRGLGTFPHLRRPRVIWVGIEPADEKLLTLQAGVEEGLAGLGFAPEKRRFRPHLTLGRVKGRGGRSALAAAVESRGSLELGRIRIDEITLFESRLSPRGARYLPVGTYRLGSG